TPIRSRRAGIHRVVHRECCGESASGLTRLARAEKVARNLWHVSSVENVCSPVVRVRSRTTIHLEGDAWQHVRAAAPTGRGAMTARVPRANRTWSAGTSPN